MIFYGWMLKYPFMISYATVTTIIIIITIQKITEMFIYSTAVYAKKPCFHVACQPPGHWFQHHFLSLQHGFKQGTSRDEVYYMDDLKEQLLIAT